VYIPIKQPVKQSKLDEIFGDAFKAENVETLEEVEGARRAEEQERVLPKIDVDIVRYVIGDRLMSAIIKSIAEDIAKEDPKRLFRDFLYWLRDIFYSNVQELLKNPGHKKKEEIRNVLVTIDDIIKKLYGRVLGIPISHSERQRHAAIILRLRTKAKESIFEINDTLLREYLEKRIPDDTFVVWVRPRKVKNFLVIGVDTSTAKVVIRLYPLVRRPLYFHVNAGCRAKISSHGLEPVLEIYPKPEDLSYLSMKDAEERGYVIRLSTLYSVSEEFHGRIREAQMNTIEYMLVKESMENLDPLEGSPDVIYLDGRIFPYEHKLDDCIYGEHWLFVYRSLRAFRNLISTVDSNGERTIVAGAVKRGNIGFLSFLVLWYAREKGIINDKDLLDFLTHRQGVRDSEIATLLLGTLYKKRLTRGIVPRTFAIIRGFYFMEDRLRTNYVKYAQSANDECSFDFWFERVNLLGESDYPGLRGYFEAYNRGEGFAETYADLCARAWVAMFYFIPPWGNGVNWDILLGGKWRIDLPRFEVAIPYKYYAIPRFGGLQKEKISKLIDSAIILPEIIDSNTFYIYYDARELGNAKNITVPLPIFLAHLLAKHITKDAKNTYEGVLDTSLRRTIRVTAKKLEELARKQQGLWRKILESIIKDIRRWIEYE